MHANSPGSYVASLALHAAVAALIFLLTFWYTRRAAEVPPVIFELVKGPPTDPNATVAGTGTPDIDVDLPKIKPLSREAMRPAPEVVPDPPVAEPKQPVKAPPKTETKRKAETKKTADELKKMSYDQFVKQHGKPQPKQTAKASAPAKAPRLNMEKVLGELRSGAAGGGGQGGTAESREDQGLLANYIVQLVAALRLAYENPSGVSEGLEAQVTFHIAANGDISNVRIARSSGDPDFDRAALEAFRRVGSIGPPPTRRADTWTIRFRATD